MYETINFATWLTGHDEEVIVQMYNDWKKSQISPVVKRSQISRINLLDRALKSNGCETTNLKTNV
jgi:hypothetical protein